MAATESDDSDTDDASREVAPLWGLRPMGEVWPHHSELGSVHVDIG